MTERDARRAALLRAQAAADDELGAADALKFERDMDADPALRKAWLSARALRAAVRRSTPAEPAPPALRDKISALVAAEPPKARRPWNQMSRGLLAASLAAAGFLAGYVAAQVGSGSKSAIPAALVASYARSQLSGQPFDIASSDRHTVKPWLAARTPLGTDVVDLADAGFPLAGGRLDIVDGTPVATLVYRRREHWIDVTELPLRDARPAGTTSVDGYRARQWSDGARAYVAISDIDESELEAFVEAFQKKAAPSGADPKPGP